MKNAHFKSVEQAPLARQEWGRWQESGRERNVKLGQHTAVVVGVEGDVVWVVAEWRGTARGQ